jgi:hypothetical protein
MKDRLSKLMTIKSIVTIILTVVFAYLSIVGVIGAEQFMLVFTTVIAFYFGTQKEKKDQAAESTTTVMCPLADTESNTLGIEGGEAK